MFLNGPPMAHVGTCDAGSPLALLCSPQKSASICRHKSKREVIDQQNCKGPPLAHESNGHTENAGREHAPLHIGHRLDALARKRREVHSRGVIDDVSQPHARAANRENASFLQMPREKSRRDAASLNVKTELDSSLVLRVVSKRRAAASDNIHHTMSTDKINHDSRTRAIRQMHACPVPRTLDGERASADQGVYDVGVACGLDRCTDCAEEAMRRAIEQGPPHTASRLSPKFGCAARGAANTAVCLLCQV